MESRSRLPSMSLSLLAPILALVSAWSQELEIARVQGGGWAYDGQGEAMASDGNRLLVGAPFGRSYAIDGSVRIYERAASEPSGWRETQRIEAPGYGTIDRFGSALDIDGDILAVGAWRESDARGAVYIFERPIGATAYELRARLEPPLDWPGQRFGYSLDLDGERLLVSAPRGAPPPDLSWEGRVYVYERDPGSGLWLEVATLARPDLPGVAQANLGHSLALAGDLALLSTYYTGFGLALEIHVFVREGGVWHHRQTLSERDVGGPGLQSFFGIDFALQGDELFALDPDRAAVHVFQRTPAGPAEFVWSSSFPGEPGMVVTVSGDRLAIGRPFGRSHDVHLYERRAGNWLPRTILSGFAPEGTFAFGSSILLDADRILVGDPALPGPTQPEVGGVRVYRVPMRPGHPGRR